MSENIRRPLEEVDNVLVNEAQISKIFRKKLGFFMRKRVADKFVEFVNDR